MSHSHLPPTSAIFSPSVARAAAAATKDWNFIDSWLATRFHHLTGRSQPPPFERNPDTLRALLNLATLNESADEDRDLLAKFDAEALAKLEAHQDDEEEQEDVKTVLLDAISDSLPRDGQTALTALATAAVELGIAYPDPVALGKRMVEIESETAAQATMLARVETIRKSIALESKKIQDILGELQSSDYRQPASLAKDNLDMQRRVKNLASRVPELRERAQAGGKGRPASDIRIEDVSREEEQFQDLLRQKSALDAQVRAFQGLPTDTDLARRELETLRGELRKMEQRRDNLFEGLVERETPRKGR